MLGPTKTKKARTAPLVGPLGEDLREWRAARGDPADTCLVFPAPSGGYWSRSTYNNWRGRVWSAAIEHVIEGDPNLGGFSDARPYDCRASFISLQLLAGFSPLQVAAWAGHSARVMFDHYAGIIEDLEGAERVAPDVLISNARAVLAEQPKERVRELVEESLKPVREVSPGAAQLLLGRGRRLQFPR